MIGSKKDIISPCGRFRHFSCLLLAVLFCLVLSRDSMGERPRTEDSEQQTMGEREVEEDTNGPEKGDGGTGNPPAERSAGESSESQEEHWADKGQETISQTVSGLARRFDSFFGDPDTAEERDFTHGRIDLGVWWDQKDEFDFPTDVRVNLSLPNFDRRLNAFLGRTSRQESIIGTSEEFEGLPSIFQDLAKEKDRDEWLLGFGYSPVRDKRNRFDLDAGVNISSSTFDPFAKMRYRSNIFLGDHMLLRLRPTIYWESEDGFGTSFRTDLDRVFSTDVLVRWASSAHYSETTEGVEWWSNIKLFQHLGAEKGLMYTVGISGETEAPVEIKNYSAGLLYRQQFFREWLSGLIGTSVKWPQDEPRDERAAVFGLGVGVEIRFGQRPEDSKGR